MLASLLKGFLFGMMQTLKRSRKFVVFGIGVHKEYAFFTFSHFATNSLVLRIFDLSEQSKVNLRRNSYVH